MAAVMLQVIPSFCTNYSKNSLFTTANRYEKFTLSKEHCFAGHDDKMCFLLDCRYYIILIGDIKEPLQKSDVFFFNSQPADCLYTISKYRFTGKNVVNSGVIICRGQIISTSRTERGWNDQHRDKEILEEKLQENNCLAPSKRLKRHKLVDKSLETELNQLKGLNSNWN